MAMYCLMGARYVSQLRHDDIVMIVLLVVVALMIYVTATVVRINKINKETEETDAQESYMQRTQRLDQAFKESREISLDEFFILKNAQEEDVPGVYILHNTSNEKYYVGQSSHIIHRVMQHFLGHGNGDVYADYRSGHEFRVRLVKLVGSGYEGLDMLERDMIAKYDALETGYNKTAGNGIE